MMKEVQKETNQGLKVDREIEKSNFISINIWNLVNISHLVKESLLQTEKNTKDHVPDLDLNQVEEKTKKREK